MSGLKALFKHDYQVDGPTFYDPKQPKFSLFKTMMMWVGLNLSIDVLMLAVLERGTSFNVYSAPWLLLMWMSVGVASWWGDKVLYESWLSKRNYSALRTLTPSSIEKGVQP